MIDLYYWTTPTITKDSKVLLLGLTGGNAGAA